MSRTPESPRGEDLLTTVEVAAMLRIHPSSVRRWIERGEVEAIQLPGGRYRVPRSEVERLLRKPRP